MSAWTLQAPRSWARRLAYIPFLVILLWSGAAQAQPAPDSDKEAVERVYQKLLAEEQERAGSDQIQLMNGTLLRGKILAESPDTIRFETPEKIITSIGKDRIQSIERGAAVEVTEERKVQLRADAERMHRELYKALATPVSLDFKATPFASVVKFITSQTGLRITLDPSLGSKPITVKIDQVPLQQALETMAAQAGGRVEIGLRQARILPVAPPKPQRPAG